MSMSSAKNLHLADISISTCPVRRTVVRGDHSKCHCVCSCRIRRTGSSCVPAAAAPAAAPTRLGPIGRRQREMRQQSDSRERNPRETIGRISGNYRRIARRLSASRTSPIRKIEPVTHTMRSSRAPARPQPPDRVRRARRTLPARRCARRVRARESRAACRPPLR